MNFTRSAALLSCALRLYGAENAGLPVLTSPAEVRFLKSSEAARNYPAQFTGVAVLGCSADSGYIVLDNGRDGLFVERPASLHCTRGDSIEISGVTIAGAFAPAIIKTRGRVLKTKQSVEPMRLGVSDLMSGHYDSDWIQVSGIVHEVSMSAASLLPRFDTHAPVLDLIVYDRGLPIKVRIREHSSARVEDYRYLVDSVIQVRGVCATVFNKRRQFISPQLFAPSEEDMSVLERAGAEPFLLPFSSLDELLSFDSQRNGHRARIKGTVLFQRPGEYLYVRSDGDSRGFLVNAPDAQAAALGERIDVVGFPLPGDHSPVIDSAEFRSLGRGPAPLARRTTPAEILSQDLDATLVSVEGQALENGSLLDPELSLQHAGVVFSAIFPAGFTTKKDSTVRITGIARLVSNGKHLPSTVQVLLRSAADAQVLSTGPLWTAGRLEQLGGALAILLLVFVAWGISLRRRVAHAVRQVKDRDSELVARQNEWLLSQARIESDNQLRLVTDALPVLVIHCDAQRIVTFCNGRYEAWFGHHAETARGRTIEGALGTEIYSAITAGLDRAFDGASGEFEIEASLPLLGDRILLARVLPDWNVSKVRGAVALIEDISDQRRMQENLSQARKMQALGSLAGGIAHDFNNMLCVILGHAELVQPEDKMDPGDSLGEIKNAARRAADLTSQLLAFSRKQVLLPRVLDVNASIWHLQGLLTRLLGERVQLRTKLAGDLGNVLVDPGQLDQVIINLAVNARDAMPDGGPLTITTANIDIDSDFARAHDGMRPGRYVVLSVADQGTGMKPEVRARLFDPFFTTKAAGKGTGLGLSIIYGIVQQSGGYIEVESALGEGSTFRVYLARTDAPIDVDEADGGDPSSARGSILVIEDDAAVRRLVTRALATKGYVVHEAVDGASGLEYLASNSGIDAVLSDVVMPGMKASELASRIRALDAHIPVVFTSGYTDAEPVDSFVLDDEMYFVQKPFEMSRLLETMVKALEQRVPKWPDQTSLV